jgi:hypothetical protein
MEHYFVLSMQEKTVFLFYNNDLQKLLITLSIQARTILLFYTELGIRYFLPYSLIALPLLQCTISLSLLRYFSEFCNTLFAICYSLLPLTSLIGFIVVDFLNFN